MHENALSYVFFVNFSIYLFFQSKRALAAIGVFWESS